MSYFKTSYKTIEYIARAGRFEDVAGFMVLARHASGLGHAGFPPYKLSGAGANAIHEKAGMSEETARAVLARLQELGVIRVVPTEIRKTFHHARWEIMQDELDLQLSHSLVDEGKVSGFDSPLRRIRKLKMSSEGPDDTTLDEHVNSRSLDVLMTLLTVYQKTSMSKFGGLSPACIKSVWDVISKTPAAGGVRWEATRNEGILAADAFVHECLGYNLKTERSSCFEEKFRRHLLKRFASAWHDLQKIGLIYEVVANYNLAPDERDAELWCTLRVNDFHAGSTAKNGDPSLLRDYELMHGTKLSFYTPPENTEKKPEGLWVVLPDELGGLYGIWRPRFRAATPDAGHWNSQEKKRIAEILDSVENKAKLTGSNGF